MLFNQFHLFCIFVSTLNSVFRCFSQRKNYHWMSSSSTVWMSLTGKTKSGSSCSRSFQIVRSWAKRSSLWEQEKWQGCCTPVWPMMDSIVRPSVERCSLKREIKWSMNLGRVSQPSWFRQMCCQEGSMLMRWLLMFTTPFLEFHHNCSISRSACLTVCGLQTSIIIEIDGFHFVLIKLGQSWGYDSIICKLAGITPRWAVDCLYWHSLNSDELCLCETHKYWYQRLARIDFPDCDWSTCWLVEVLLTGLPGIIPLWKTFTCLRCILLFGELFSQRMCSKDGTFPVLLVPLSTALFNGWKYYKITS